MNINIDLDFAEMSELLNLVCVNRALHLKFVSAIMKEEGYENKSGIGPSVIPFSWWIQSCPGTLKDNVWSGLKINAYKIVREHLGLGLKEAKDIVDSFMTERRAILSEGQFCD
jgi:hypothetical protein